MRPEIEINEVLIVGDSDTSIQFSRNLISVANFTRIVHVIKADDAISLLIQEQYPVIVLDHDAPDVDCIYLSDTIRKNLPLSRIIIIAKEYSAELFKILINEGFVDVFLPIPVDDYSATSILAEQQAKYQINKMLNQLVVDKPPKFSPNYYLLHDPTLKGSPGAKPQFLGFVINYASVTKFSKFYSDLFKQDEYLVTGYISAISMLGQKLLEDNTTFQEINFGGISIVLKKDGDLTYIFFFKNLTKHNYEEVENEIFEINQYLAYNVAEDLLYDRTPDQKVHKEIEKIIDNLNEKYSKLTEIDKIHNIVIYGNHLPKLNQILKKLSYRYKIQRYMDSKDVLSHLMDNRIDCMIINQILKDNDWNFGLAKQIKDIQPSLQIIALLKRPKQYHMMKVLNNENLDYVLSYTDDPEEMIKQIEIAANKTKQIREQTTEYAPHNLQLAFHQSEITRNLLRSFQHSFELSHIPELYGLFIIREDFPFYSKFFPVSDETKFDIDEQMFAGFINSVDMFSDEILDAKDGFSGLKLGDINLITKKNFDLIFVYFIGKLDHTNFLAADKQLKQTTLRLTEYVLNSEGFTYNSENFRTKLTHLIYQTTTELALRFLSLNLVEI